MAIERIRTDPTVTAQNPSLYPQSTICDPVRFIAGATHSERTIDTKHPTETSPVQPSLSPPIRPKITWQGGNAGA
jgi:hypothetical protein